MTHNRIEIAVIDDHPLFREGVVFSLSEEDDCKVVASGASASEAIRIAQEFKPDIVLLDISLPGGGLNAISDILSFHPKARIVMLTASEAVGDVSEALRRGACGYVLKGVGSQELGNIIRDIFGGDQYVSPSLSAQIISSLSTPAQPDRLGRLTDREREILDLVSSGLSNKRIALKLELQEKTVKHHVSSILAKLGVQNRTEAAMVLRDLRGLSA